MSDETPSASNFALTANPCDNPPKWPPAPAPTKNPLAVMQWATGQKKDKFGCTRDAGKNFHAGIDIKAAIGTPCFSTEDATVKDVGTFGELGLCVGISFTKSGDVYGVAYCHLKKASVKVGESLKAGQQVGECGISGNAEPENPHLHLEVQNQVWVAYNNSADRSKYGLNPNSYIS